MISVTVLLPLMTAAVLLSLSASRGIASRESVPGELAARESAPPRLEHRVAVLGTLATLVFAIANLFALQMDGSWPPTHLVERHEWVPGLGVTATFRIDGMNVFPFVATALLSCVAILSSRDRAAGPGRMFLVAALVLETALLGVFAAQDAVLLIVFLQGAVLCVYSLLLMDGKTKQRIGAIQLVLWMSAGVAGLLLTVLHVQGSLVATVATADVFELGRAVQALPSEPGLRGLFFLAGVGGGAILLPLFPVHRWLASAHKESSPPTEILLAGLLGVGLFCFLRVALPLFPGAATDLAPWLMTLAIISVIVAAVGSLLESDAKGLVYWFSIAHLGLALAGLLTFTIAGVVGSLFLLVNHSLSATALYLLLDALGRRRLSQRIGETRSLGRPMPRYARVLLLVMGSAVGILPASGFVGVVLVARGLLDTGGWGAATLALIGVLTIAASLTVFCSRLLFPVRRIGTPLQTLAARSSSAPDDLGARELATVLPLALLMVAGGVFSSWFADRMTPTVQEWLEAFR